MASRIIPSPSSLPSTATFSALKSTRLQRLAIALGVPSSGTKAVLASRLQLALQRPRIAHGAVPLRGSGAASEDQSEHRVLSIDMGIRNLAYCTLALPGAWAASSSSPSPSSSRPSPPPPLPTLLSWSRLAVSSKAKPSSNASNQQGTTTAATATATSAAAPSKESFDPPILAGLANDLVRRLVLDSARPPHTVLIERQRFRTGGGAAVQEWTLRVNVFEAMLWAVLTALRRSGAWEGQVWAVEPARVAKFWGGMMVEGEEDGEGLGGEEDGGGRERKGEGKGKGKAQAQAQAKGEGKDKGIGKGAAKKVKQQRVDLVGSWLEAQDAALAVEAGSPARETRRRYLQRWKGLRATTTTTKGSRKKEEEPGEDAFGKLDDLADCLLQAMAWVKWEENRRALQQGGVDALG